MTDSRSIGIKNELKTYTKLRGRKTIIAIIKSETIKIGTNNKSSVVIETATNLSIISRI